MFFSMFLRFRKHDKDYHHFTLAINIFPNMSSPFSIIFLTYFLFVGRYWPYGSEGCQIHGFQGFLTALASISSSAAVAWDRYHHYCTSKGYNLPSNLTQILL